MKEFIKFCIVGAITFILDYGLLFFFTERLQINYLLSTALAFSIAVIVNYILCLLFVFTKSKNGRKQFILFIYASLGGLLLNQLSMWFLVEKLSIYYMFAKIISTIIVTLWNYLTKKRALKT